MQAAETTQERNNAGDGGEEPRHLLGLLHGALLGPNANSRLIESASTPLDACI